MEKAVEANWKMGNEKISGRNTGSRVRVIRFKFMPSPYKHLETIHLTSYLTFFKVYFYH